MGTDTAKRHPVQARVWSAAGLSRFERLLDLRLLLIVMLALAAGFLAYQAPPRTDINVGWLGDQLFLPTSEGLRASDAGRWYGDEATDDATSGRSRWTRREAPISLPGVGGAGLSLLLRMRGWPDDVLNERTSQPAVSVEVDGAVVARFEPTSAWAEYVVDVPAEARSSSDLHVILRVSDTFTSTQQYNDLRPKGVRVEYIGVRGAELPGLVLPAFWPLVLLILAGSLSYALLGLLRGTTFAFVAATLVVSALAVGLTIERAWVAALLPVCAGLPAALLGWHYRGGGSGCIISLRGALLRAMRSTRAWCWLPLPGSPVRLCT